MSFGRTLYINFVIPLKIVFHVLLFYTNTFVPKESVK